MMFRPTGVTFCHFAIFFVFKTRPLETESLADAQFVIDRCCLVSQSSFLNNSNKAYDWLILACFIREKMHADAIFPRLENQIWLENLS